MNLRRTIRALAFLFGTAAVALPLTAQTFYNVKNYGATGNGVSLDTAAIQSAVNAANSAGGGIVAFPPGTYKMTGVRLTNNITVVFTNGAVLVASTNQSDWAGAVTKIFYATNSHGITLTGPALMDGGGLFFYQGDPGSVISGKTLSHMLEFHYCTNVTLSGLHLQNSCVQTITFNDCSHVTVTSVTVTNRPREFGSGDDGIDFSDCGYVTASNLNIETGDDGICVKTETNHFGAHDIWIENCTVATTTMATKIGTATYSPAWNIVLTNITVNRHSGIVIGANNPLPDGRCEAAINVCMCNGGFNHDLVFTHYIINDCSIPIYLEVNDRSGNGFGMTSNVFFGDINCLNASNACQFNVEWGATNHLLNLTISNLTVHNFETYGGTDSPPYQDGGYPYGYKIGSTVVHMPAYGLLARWVRGLHFAGENRFFDDGHSGRPDAVALENCSGVTTNLPANGGPPPAFNSIENSGGTNLMLNGSGGRPNGTFYLLAAASLTLPLTNWPALATNRFDANGNFKSTNAANPPMGAQFFRLLLSPP
jgi:Glycosyl hydrolases family 28